MNRLAKFIVLTFLLVSCNAAPLEKEEQAVEKEVAAVNDTMPKITGIGGVFFKSKNPEEIKAWYSQNLGLIVDDFGAPFEFRNTHRPEERNYLNWDAFVDSTDYFDPSEKEFMINYRVQNLDGLLERFKKNGVTILDEVVSVEYGKFVHIMDPEGNKIELWEPVDSVLTTFGRVTNK